jgi:hypothetical protein
MKNILIHTVVPAFCFYLGVIFCLKMQEVTPVVVPHTPNLEDYSPTGSSYGDYEYYYEEDPDYNYDYSDKFPGTYEEYDYEDEGSTYLEVI